MNDKQPIKETETFSIDEIATHTEKVIRSNLTNENIDMISLLVKIANDIAEIKKNLV